MHTQTRSRWTTGALIVLTFSLLVLAAATAAPAEARGLTCKYRLPIAGGALVLDGYDNQPSFCRTFGGGGTFKRMFGPPPGVLVCRFESLDLDMRITVYARNYTVGSGYCQKIKRTTRGMYARTR